MKAVEISPSQAVIAQKPQDEVAVVLISPLPKEPKEQRKATNRRTKRLASYEQIQALRSQGLSGRAIAESRGIGRATVFRYLRHATFPERQGRSAQGRSLLDADKEQSLEHWNGGCHAPKGLFEQIQQFGYAGSYDTVARYTCRWRFSQEIPLTERLVKKPLPFTLEPSKRIFTPGRARNLVLIRSQSIGTEDEGLTNRLKASHPELDEAIKLAQDFACLVRQRQPQLFDDWLEKAKNISLSLFRRFAAGLDSDYKAVKAGITLETSN